MAQSRISGQRVPLFFPKEGPVKVLCIGEAPGPRGADKSGIPFLGDRAGVHLYRALKESGVCFMPEGADTLPWNGKAFRDASAVPTLKGVALGNAYDICPTDDGLKFRAPSKHELYSQENQDRLISDINVLKPRGLQAVLTLGRVSYSLMQYLKDNNSSFDRAVNIHGVAHPSAQGLLSTAPNRGKGAKMDDLAMAWRESVMQILKLYGLS